MPLGHCPAVWVHVARVGPSESVIRDWNLFISSGTRRRDLSDTKSTGAKLSICFIPSAWHSTALTFLRTLIIKITQINSKSASTGQPGSHGNTPGVHLFQISPWTQTTLTEGLVVFLSHFNHIRENILKLGHNRFFLHIASDDWMIGKDLGGSDRRIIEILSQNLRGWTEEEHADS